MLELDGENEEKWRVFVDSFDSNFILLKEEEEDSLYWLGNDKTGVYTFKQGYLVLVAEDFSGDRKWWWKYIWSHKEPIK